MILPLKDVCIKQIAKDIIQGKTTSTHQKLDTKTNNQVFREFLERSFEECFSESCQHIKNLLSVTEVQLDCYYCDENVCKMIYDQNIEELTLDRLNFCKMFRLVGEEDDSTKKEDRRFPRRNIRYFREEEESEGSDDEDVEVDDEDVEVDDEDVEVDDEDVGVDDEDVERNNRFNDLFEEMMSLRREREERENPTVRRVDIIAVLEKMLNLESRKKLKKLEIDGTYLEFVEGWVEKLAALLPSLQTLQIHLLPFEASVIQTIYDNFPNLTCLEISGAKISNLNGISKLQNLTCLTVSGIEFGGYNDIKELFSLRKLRKLHIDGDFESDPKIKNLVYYLESDQFLPELRYMDCTNCEITEEMLQKLVETHPKLETILLLQTSLENHPRLEIPGRYVKLITMGSFKDCLNTIKFVVELGGSSSPYLISVFSKMMEILNSGYQEISQQELRDCLKLMLDIAYNAWELQDDAFRVLEEICRGNRASMFTFEERQNLIFSLIRTIHKPYEMDPYDTRLVMSKSLWRVLRNPIIFFTSPDNIDQLCEEAGEAYYGFGGNMNWPRVQCAEILCDYMEKMSVDRGRALAQNKELWKNTMDLMDTDDTVNQPIYPKLIQTIYKVKNRRSDKMDQQCITVLSNCMRNADDDEYKTLVVETVKIVIGYMKYDVVKRILDLPWWLGNYLKMLYNNNKLVQQSATAFILLFLYPHDPKPALEKFIMDIREALEGFEHVEGTDEYSNGLKWIRTHSNDQIINNFCEFMIEKIEKEVDYTPDSDDDVPIVFRHYSFDESIDE